MLTELSAEVPPDALKIVLVLALAFFIGLEREEHKQREPGYAFGGIRTFPLIGLVSYALALLSHPLLVPWVVGFAVVGGFMLLSYNHKLADANPAGLTTEISALATFVVGGLVQRERYWIATTIAVLSVLAPRAEEGPRGPHQAHPVGGDRHGREVPGPVGGRAAGRSPIGSSRAFT